MPATPWPVDFATTLAVAALASLFFGAFLPPKALRRTTTTAFAFAVAFACTWMVPGIREAAASAPVPLGGDVVGAVFFVLVTGIGLVVARYSTRYLDGDPGLPGYARALLLTLGSVGVLVLSDDLLVASLAWVATSFALQPLLTHFPERPSAVVAAHKKFLVARASEVFLATTLVLVGTSVGSFRYERIVAWVHERPTLPPAMQVAAVCLVVVVALRTAQLPFHGWLLQVMEAPTPVSALLHAGVVNVGGFVLVRTSPWLAKSPAAQAVLVTWGLTTLLVASFVRKTRVSVKVDLAWSTCAQMGFMLVECGLGAWSLAFLHIVAHSLYKAHAFLASGSAVDDYRAASLLGPRSPSSTTSVPRRSGDVGGSWAVPLAASVAAAAVNVLGQVGPGTTLAMLALLGLSPLSGPIPSAIEGARAALVRRVAVAGTLLAVGHLAAGRLIPHVPFENPFHGLDGGLVLVAFGLARAFEVLLANRPDGPWARRLYPHAFAGFHLDDALTGWVFAWWHPRKPIEPAGRTPAWHEAAGGAR
ncbi:MAG: NADH-quinone oxidoreductase subunit L [Polyangiaceae bacterium]